MNYRAMFLAAAALAAVLAQPACHTTREPVTTPPTPTTKPAMTTTKPDKVKTGAVAGALIGEGEADEILAGAAVGAGIGAGVGAYMDRQERDLTEIPGTTVERAGDDTLLIRMDPGVLFERNSATLGISARDMLDRSAEVLQEYPKTAVVVQGFSDGLSSESANMELSQQRADSVRNYLIGRGVDPDRMVAVGYGETYVSDRSDSRGVDLLIKAKAT